MRRVGPWRIWVTRTQPEAGTTAERLRAMGHEPVAAPVLVSRRIPRAAIDPAGIDLADIEALAFTSAAGVRAFADLSPARDLAVFAVGAATAEAARAAGFGAVRTAGGDVQALATAIADARPGRVLNPTARKPAADLVALLAARGAEARSVVVYETVPAPEAPPEAIDAVLVHSARAARIIAGLIGPDRAPLLTVFAISEAAAAPLRGLPFARVVAAPFPDEASLLDLLQA